MGIMTVTVKETGLKKTVNTYSLMSVNELPAAEDQEVGCELVVLQPKEKLVEIHVEESFAHVSKEWEKEFPKLLIPRPTKKRKPTKKKAVVKKKPVAKKKVVKKAVAKKAPVKKKVVRKKTK